jgi:hypothetical protein
MLYTESIFIRSVVQIVKTKFFDVGVSIFLMQLLPSCYQKGLEYEEGEEEGGLRCRVTRHPLRTAM